MIRERPRRSVDRPAGESPMNDPSRASPRDDGEITTWAVIFIVLGWTCLVATVLGGAGETPYYSAAGLVLTPLGFGLLFRWSWARWAGLLLFTAVACWSIWRLIQGQVWLLSLALLLVSGETMWCLWRWGGRSRDR